MLGRKNKFGAGKNKAAADEKKKSWRDAVNENSESEEAPALTEGELEEFRKASEREEREERLKRSREILEKQRVEEEKSKKPTGKRTAAKAFAWMDDEDEDEDAGAGQEEEEEAEQLEQRAATGLPKLRELPPGAVRGKQVLPPTANLPVGGSNMEEGASGPAMRHPSGMRLDRPVPLAFQGREHLYKTRLCERWQNGFCQWGASACNYAHGQSELRADPGGVRGGGDGGRNHAGAGASLAGRGAGGSGGGHQGSGGGGGHSGIGGVNQPMTNAEKLLSLKLEEAAPGPPPGSVGAPSGGMMMGGMIGGVNTKGTSAHDRHIEMTNMMLMQAMMGGVAGAGGLPPQQGGLGGLPGAGTMPKSVGGRSSGGTGKPEWSRPPIVPFPGGPSGASHDDQGQAKRRRVSPPTASAASAGGMIGAAGGTTATTNFLAAQQHQQSMEQMMQLQLQMQWQMMAMQQLGIDMSGGGTGHGTGAGGMGGGEPQDTQHDATATRVKRIPGSANQQEKGAGPPGGKGGKRY